MSIILKNLSAVLENIFSIKKIEQDKANSITDLKGIDEAAWNFILSIYNTGWDKLIIDGDNFSFRYKVKIQFNLPSNSINISRKGKDIAKPASISSLSLLILAKSPKEINTIFKYFKKPSNNKGEKLYAQASALLSNVTREILKIKKTFPKLQDKKIEHI